MISGVDLDYTTLDPGIREVVRLLRGAGFDTCDSGDGTSKGADGSAPEDGCWMPRPHVVIRTAPMLLLTDARWALKVLREAGVAFDLSPEEVDRVVDGDETVALRQVEATFDPVSGIALVTVWGVTDADLEGR